MKAGGWKASTREQRKKNLSLRNEALWRPISTERVLETMSADDRLVLTLVDGEDAPVKEVAAMTGWSESKVKVQAFRARRRMREAVEKLLGK